MAASPQTRPPTRSGWTTLLKSLGMGTAPAPASRPPAVTGRSPLRTRGGTHVAPADAPPRPGCFRVATPGRRRGGRWGGGSGCRGARCTWSVAPWNPESRPRDPRRRVGGGPEAHLWFQCRPGRRERPRRGGRGGDGRRRPQRISQGNTGTGGVGDRRGVGPSESNV